jgi:dipeptidyl aminopeptidase/acylaminoacyl peptidase
VQVLDRGDNVADERPAFTARRADVAVADTEPGSAAATVRTVGEGRAHVVVTAGAARDSAAVSVVPPGTLLARDHGTGLRFRLLTTSGSTYRLLHSTPLGYNHTSPYFAPTGDRAVLHQRLVGDSARAFRLFTLDLGGAARELLATPGGTGNAIFPQPSRDGQWVYFASERGYRMVELWRARADGGGAERVGAPARFAEEAIHPAPSPDGRALAFVRASPDGGLGSVAVLDLGTGQARALGRDGSRPRWSPDGTEIGFLDGNRLWVARADGSRADQLGAGTAFQGYEGQVDWSPDGRWLVTCVGGRFLGDKLLALVRRTTGEVLPLPFTAADKLCEATWKP